VEGLLSTAGDVASLQEALGRLLPDPGLRASLASAAQARARREFTVEAMVDAYESLYHLALASGGA